MIGKAGVICGVGQTIIALTDGNVSFGDVLNAELWIVGGIAE